MLKKMLYKPWFSAPIRDELALLNDAEKLLARNAEQLDAQGFSDLTSEQGVDMATACFYLALLNSHHGEFKDKIDAFPVTHVKKNTFRLLIVPGMFHDIHPETGADGYLLKQLAKEGGIDAQMVATTSSGAVAENASKIDQAVKSNDKQALWLISFSKGASEVRYYLQSYSVPDNVCGWINIAGIYSGTPYVDRMLSSVLSRAYYRVACKMMGLGFCGLNDLSTANPIWHCTEWPNINIIHIVPIPLKSHLQTHLIQRHTVLEQYGPNDGCVPLAQVLSLPGSIYPLWGSDHFLRSPEVPRLMYKLLHYIAIQTNQ